MQPADFRLGARELLLQTWHTFCVGQPLNEIVIPKLCTENLMISNNSDECAKITLF